MSTTAQTIIDQAWEDLNDDGTRWPAATMLKHLNSGQTVIVNLKPLANPVTAQVSLVAGAAQSLPAGTLGLIRPVRNITAAGGYGRVPTVVTPDKMDGLYPDWHLQRAAAEVRYVIYDPNQPKKFYTYPPQPASTAHKLEVVHAAVPAAVAAVGNNISLDDEYVPALVDYLVYRAFAKDSAVIGAAQRSDTALRAFAAKLGVPLSAARQAVQQQGQP